MLKPRRMKPECTSVALSGVRNAGSAAHGTGRPLNRAGMKPMASVALSDCPAATVRIQAITVAAVSATVLVRGIRFTSLPPFVPSEVEGSDELDLLDLVVTVAGGRRDLDLVALLAPDQRPAERRIVADPPILGVGLGLADQLVPDLLAVLVGQGDGRAKHDLVAT